MPSQEMCVQVNPNNVLQTMSDDELTDEYLDRYRDKDGRLKKRRASRCQPPSTEASIKYPEKV